MHMRPFKLERYFAEHEFQVPYTLSASDCESLSLKDLLALADERTLNLWHDLSLGYTETQGHPRLREEISTLYDTISPDQVLVAAPAECIVLAMHALLRRGDHVIVLSPAYQSLYEVPRAIGCEVTPWELRLEATRWRLDLDALEAAITATTRLLVINFPHNPTGFLPQAGDLQRIIDLAADRGAHVFSDEMYRLLEYEDGQRLPAVCDVYERGVSLFGLSKTFSLPGLRIGWLAARDPEVIRHCRVLRDYTTICSSAPSEVLALMALRAKEAIRDRNLAIIQQNLEAAEGFFAEHRDAFVWPRPQAGSVAFPKFLLDAPLEQVCEEVRRQKGVLMVHAGLFEYPGPHFRLGLGRHRMPEALARVGQYLSESGLT